MAAPAIPSDFIVQQGNGQVYLSWAITAGAVTYDVQRSTDGVTYSALATPAVNNYLDTSVSTGVKYFYKVATVGTGGTSSYCSPQDIIPTPTSEMSLAGLRLAAQQRADREESQFVTVPEWNFFINQAMFELYDLLITVYEDYFVATPAKFTTDGTTQRYNLPNGVLTFTNDSNQSFVAKPFYKLLGVDLGLNSANNAWVTVNKFNFIDRNRYVYPNQNSTIYGVFNLQYRLVGDKIEFIPTPSSGQPIRLWYIPRLDQLLQDTDLTTIGFSGWLQYVIIRAAKYALDKEESDTSKLDQELIFLKQRIEESAMNRDAGQADKISDVRSGGNWNDGWRGGTNGAIGGWAISAPILTQHNVANDLLTYSVFGTQLNLGYVFAGITLSYLFYLNRSKLGGRIGLSGIRNLISKGASTLLGHISHVIKLGSKKKVVGSDTLGVVASMTNEETLRYHTFMQLVTEPMSKSVSTRSEQSPIARAGKASNPLPTTVRFFNSSPKSINHDGSLDKTRKVVK